MTDCVICPSTIEETVDNQAIIKNITFWYKITVPPWEFWVLVTSLYPWEQCHDSVPGLRSKMM